MQRERYSSTKHLEIPSGAIKRQYSTKEFVLPSVRIISDDNENSPLKEGFEAEGGAERTDLSGVSEVSPERNAEKRNLHLDLSGISHLTAQSESGESATSLPCSPLSLADSISPTTASAVCVHSDIDNQCEKHSRVGEQKCLSFPFSIEDEDSNESENEKAVKNVKTAKTLKKVKSVKSCSTKDHTHSLRNALAIAPYQLPIIAAQASCSCEEHLPAEKMRTSIKKLAGTQRVQESSMGCQNHKGPFSEIIKETLKIIVLGDNFVGKTAIVEQFVKWRVSRLLSHYESGENILSSYIHKHSSVRFANCGLSEGGCFSTEFTT